jgi:hypothetical protein
MNSIELLQCFTALCVKHFIVDFPLQTSYQYLNKDKFLHPGGLLHALLHGIGTFCCFVWFVSMDYVIWFAYLDAMIHYHIDMWKVNINQKLCYTSTNSEKFWWLLGLDQLLHYLTYIGFLFLTTRSM